MAAFILLGFVVGLHAGYFLCIWSLRVWLRAEGEEELRRLRRDTRERMYPN